MNAIISLCHFCENHGPHVLFCTQSFHSQNTNVGNFGVDQDTSNEERAIKNEEGLSNIEPSESKSKHDTTSNSGAVGGTETNTTKSDAKCEACRSLPPSLPGFFSNDHEADVRYVSSQYPSQARLFSMVRHACLSSLSSEISPDRDGPGPIFFGDDNSGYVLSHVFIIKDSQYSRGFQRRFSIIVVMMDKIFLLNSWPFLVRHLKSIIEELQAKAQKVYEFEQAKSPARLQNVITRTPRSLLQGSHGPINPGKPPRSFEELTGDKHIFQKLHQTFTWLLKAGGNRLTEKLLEGPPTEDSIIDVENQLETEEGFVLVESKKEVEEDDFCEEFSGVESSDEADEDSDCATFKNLRHLLRVFGYSKFHKVAHHVVIGNQIVIRGSQRKLIRSAIDCIKVLLPKGCCKTIYYSQRYEESWRCNFLGLAKSGQIPASAERYVVVDVHEPARGVDSSLDELADVQDAIQSMGLEDTDFSGYVFTVESATELPEKGPTVLNDMEFVLLNETLADSVVEQCIICFKEVWMNKVKVLFKFTRAGGSRSEEDTQGLLRVVGAEKDKTLLKFWREGLSMQYKTHMLKSNLSHATK